MTTYEEFLIRKQQSVSPGGLEPSYLPEVLFPFQRALVEWAVARGRAAVLADCGLGKSLIELVWAENVVRQTGGRVLLLTPLAVGAQMAQMSKQFGIGDCARSRDGRVTAPITIANYEQLHRFSPADFAGVVCDESSILKHFRGATQQQTTRFLAKVPYRLLCTATAAPNDYTELGSASEALGELGFVDMLGRFFKQEQQQHAMSDRQHGRGRGPVDTSVGGGRWRMKGHAEEPFWRWVSSWARACRKPSDLGFSDDGFVLPELIERGHTVRAARPPDGMLFVVPAVNLQEEREERRRTLTERCEYVAGLVDHDQPAVIWCHLNSEAERLRKVIPGAVEVSGNDSDEAKEDKFSAFGRGDVRVLITKPKIGAWGLNWQHCAHVVTFATHSYEQYYQAVRRCWRFGQTRPVVVDIVSTEGEVRVRENMMRKAQSADRMFARLTEHMRDAVAIDRQVRARAHVEVPSWLAR